METDPDAKCTLLFRWVPERPRGYGAAQRLTAQGSLHSNSLFSSHLIVSVSQPAPPDLLHLLPFLWRHSDLKEYSFSLKPKAIRIPTNCQVHFYLFCAVFKNGSSGTFFFGKVSVFTRNGRSTATSLWLYNLVQNGICSLGHLYIDRNRVTVYVHRLLFPLTREGGVVLDIF